MLRVSNFTQTDLLVFSHVRWDFIFQRPQQLMSRFAKKRRVFFIEEPTYGNFPQAQLRKTKNEKNIHVITPCLPEGLQEIATQQELKRMVDLLLAQEDIHDFTTWYYNPSTLSYTGHLRPKITVYDCTDETFATELTLLENELLKRADLLFTNTLSLYEVKRHLHKNTYCFPSSVDIAHFKQSRTKRPGPSEKNRLQTRRVGFNGVIDEQWDAELVNEVSKLRPHWQFVILGPVVKIDPRALPKRPNIHYLGVKSYQELPDYISRWDLAILPYVKNETTRFANPTKTPEYLAAGCPVVSTSIPDVVRPYGDEDLVQIGDTPEDFVKAAERAMERSNPEWLRRVDAFFDGKSWDNTVDQMFTLEQQTRLKKLARGAPYVQNDTEHFGVKT